MGGQAHALFQLETGNKLLQHLGLAAHLLAGGGALYALLAAAAPRVTAGRLWRPGYNLYNSGIAALSAGSLQLGIFQIAGTASPYTIAFYIAGGVLAAAGLGLMLAGFFPVRGKAAAE